MTDYAADFDIWCAAAQWMDSSDGQIAFWTAGTGRPLVLIHGFPTASWDWSRIWTPLREKGRRLVALDMLGFGLSDKPSGHTYDLMDQTDLHAQLLSELGISEYDIIAHDYGVSIAQELLARQDEGRPGAKIGAVVYLNGGLIPGEHRPRLIQHLMEGPMGPLVSQLLSRKRFGKAFSAVFGPDTQPSEAELDQFWQLMTHKGGHRLGHKLIRYMHDRRQHKSRWVGVLERAIVPQRLINGVLDPVSGGHLAEAYERRVDDADILRLEDVGHYPQWEAADRVLEGIVSFLER